MGASSELWWAFLRSGAMLAFVLALLVSILYVVRRFAPMNRTKKGEQKIRVIAAHHLSPKERLVLVQVLDRKVLIGVTPQTITTLVDLGDGTGERTKGGVDFSDILNQRTAGFTGKGEGHDL
ncbi:MAG: flagellar biosynthetic protein FliO [Desulfobacterium sp.]|jgi:flagellar protein FliO/FliZ|nr:flagellar biosynthetic protein FliO [Desulfobacterium sp.]